MVEVGIARYFSGVRVKEFNEFVSNDRSKTDWSEVRAFKARAWFGKVDRPRKPSADVCSGSDQRREPRRAAVA
jgi:hypothetical protein